MCEDCPICYEKAPKCRLVCGHIFHHSCIKEWYMNGNNTGCPMCRNNIYFKGMRKYKQKWETERREQQFSKIYSEAVADLVNEAKESPFIHLFFNKALQDLEEDYVIFKEVVEHPDDLKYLLYNPNEYYDVETALKKVPLYYEVPNKRKRSKLFKQPKQKTHYQRKR